MNSRVVKLDVHDHEAVHELLPWYAMQALDETDRRRVDAHVPTCSLCQKELEWHDSMRTVHAAAAPALGVDDSFAKMRMRIDAATAGMRQRPAPQAWWAAWRASAPSLRWIALGQGVVIAALLVGIALSPPPAPQLFHALSATPPAALSRPDVVVVFAPRTTEQDLRRILQASGARLVGGPTANGGYLLVLDHGNDSHALDVLRREPAVLLAEPLTATVTP
jgi:hypothetical protein